MKKYKIKCISSLCLGLMFVLLTTIPCSAHEIFYEGEPYPNPMPIVLKWNEIVGGKAHLRINGDLLDSNYSWHLSFVSTAWNNAAGKVTVVQESFSTSKVDLATASQEYWKNRWKDRAEFVLGVCDSTSTDGYDLNNLVNAKASSKKIGYTKIYFTPANTYNHDTHRRKTMVHEVGHTLGLGHPNTIYHITNDPSVMRQDTVETYYTPQQHDISDLTNKY